MSIVVAVTKGSQTALAADSLTTFSDDSCIPPENSATRKLRRIGMALLGGAGWAVYDRILDDHLRSTPEPQSLGDEGSIFRFFMDFWKALHERYAFVNDQAGSRETPFGDLDSSFLLGTVNGIFRVSHDMDVCHFKQYHAIGSGSAYAMGALQVLYPTDLDAAGLATRAVRAACALDLYCGGEVEVLTVPMQD